ncbi:anti-sigma factor domain-containing protein [Deinococcus arenicola]|uniref:Anti-sigma factor n=1 Tax=Deinococcus arenicola TaxID=2994950 RepID=A0ABU4DVV9_9DEIO|nr:anti-sigma factor [Deinococcus sp. ZS9-10]MDV6376593.1 anti-sigma factor [Deinococcus sp. ZS9-10]
MTDRDDALALALGSLSPQDAGRVDRALDTDPALLAEYRSDLAALHALPETLPPAQVPAGALDRLMERVRAEKAGQGEPPPAVTPLNASDAERKPMQTSGPQTAEQQRPQNRTLGWTLGALGLAAAVTAFLVLRPPADPLTRYAGMPGAVSQPLTGADQAQIGQVVRLTDGSAFLYLSAAPPSDRVYQLWQIKGKTPVSLGVIDGQGKLIQDAPNGVTLAVSVEPPGGSEQPTTTPILVQKL